MRGDQLHQNFDHFAYNWNTPGVKSSLDRDNQSRNDREYLGAALFQKISNTLTRQENVWFFNFTDAIEENGKEMLVVEFIEFHIPLDSSSWTFESNLKR
mmetsp:Transcript_1627/g.2027  ORF Transcript_1627/g.2027 Transcript_1627/m.2027 type:complete len:99 (-) Transcript_1627:267-563(-)